MHMICSGRTLTLQRGHEVVVRLRVAVDVRRERRQRGQRRQRRGLRRRGRRGEAGGREGGRGRRRREVSPRRARASAARLLLLTLRAPRARALLVREHDVLHTPTDTLNDITTAPFHRIVFIFILH